MKQKTVFNLSAAAVFMLLVYIGLWWTLAGCSSLTKDANPLAEATTHEQRAYAVVGQYAIFQARALELIKNEALPANFRKSLQKITQEATPVVLDLQTALNTVIEAKTALAKGETGPDKLTIASNELEQWIQKAGEPVERLVLKVMETF